MKIKLKNMKQLTVLILLLNVCFTSYGQKFKVPDSIIKELEVKEFEYIRTAKIKYKVVYPKNYDESKQYPVLLGLSGGNANDKIVNYCYYTLFKSHYFNNYITILPLGPSGSALTDMDDNEINLLIKDIKEKESVTKNNWILAGTSMGGLAAFNFAVAKPELFEGIITFPGGIREQKVSEKWKNYKIVLAVSEKDDDDWKTLNESTKSKLTGKVKSIEVFTIEGEEHIISPEYDINKVYDVYFNIKK